MRHRTQKSDRGFVMVVTKDAVAQAITSLAKSHGKIAFVLMSGGTGGWPLVFL